MKGFIKIDRDIYEWKWYKNANTFRVFFEILRDANFAPQQFENETIYRGELVTSYEKLAYKLNITHSQVRTAIKNLKMTGDITVRIRPKYQVITVVNYEALQGNITGTMTPNDTVNSQANHSQFTGKSQQYNNTNKTNNKNITNNWPSCSYSDLGTILEV